MNWWCGIFFITLVSAARSAFDDGTDDQVEQRNGPPVNSTNGSSIPDVEEEDRDIMNRATAVQKMAEGVENQLGRIEAKLNAQETKIDNLKDGEFLKNVKQEKLIRRTLKKRKRLLKKHLRLLRHMMRNPKFLDFKPLLRLLMDEDDRDYPDPRVMIYNGEDEVKSGYRRLNPINIQAMLKLEKDEWERQEAARRNANISSKPFLSASNNGAAVVLRTLDDDDDDVDEAETVYRRQDEAETVYRKQDNPLEELLNSYENMRDKDRDQGSSEILDVRRLLAKAFKEKEKKRKRLNSLLGRFTSAESTERKDEDRRRRLIKKFLNNYTRQKSDGITVRRMKRDLEEQITPSLISIGKYEECHVEKLPRLMMTATDPLIESLLYLLRDVIDRCLRDITFYYSAEQNLYEWKYRINVLKSSLSDFSRLIRIKCSRNDHETTPLYEISEHCCGTTLKPPLVIEDTKIAASTVETTSAVQETESTETNWVDRTTSMGKDDNTVAPAAATTVREPCSGASIRSDDIEAVGDAIKLLESLRQRQKNDTNLVSENEWKLINRSAEIYNVSSNPGTGGVNEAIESLTSVEKYKNLYDAKLKTLSNDHIWKLFNATAKSDHERELQMLERVSRSMAETKGKLDEYAALRAEKIEFEKLLTNRSIDERDILHLIKRLQTLGERSGSVDVKEQVRLVGILERSIDDYVRKYANASSVAPRSRRVNDADICRPGDATNSMTTDIRDLLDAVAAKKPKREIFSRIQSILDYLSHPSNQSKLLKKYNANFFTATYNFLDANPDITENAILSEIKNLFEEYSKYEYSNAKSPLLKKITNALDIQYQEYPQFNITEMFFVMKDMFMHLLRNHKEDLIVDNMRVIINRMVEDLKIHSPYLVYGAYIEMFIQAMSAFPLNKPDILYKIFKKTFETYDHKTNDKELFALQGLITLYMGDLEIITADFSDKLIRNVIETLLQQKAQTPSKPLEPITYIKLLRQLSMYIILGSSPVNRKATARTYGRLVSQVLGELAKRHPEYDAKKIMKGLIDDLSMYGDQIFVYNPRKRNVIRELTKALLRSEDGRGSRCNADQRLANMNATEIVRRLVQVEIEDGGEEHHDLAVVQLIGSLYEKITKELEENGNNDRTVFDKYAGYITDSLKSIRDEKVNKTAVFDRLLADITAYEKMVVSFLVGQSSSDKDISTAETSELIQMLNLSDALDNKPSFRVSKQSFDIMRNIVSGKLRSDKTMMDTNKFRQVIDEFIRDLVGRGRVWVGRNYAEHFMKALMEVKEQEPEMDTEQVLGSIIRDLDVYEHQVDPYAAEMVTLLRYMLQQHANDVRNYDADRALEEIDKLYSSRRSPALHAHFPKLTARISNCDPQRVTRSVTNHGPEFERITKNLIEAFEVLFNKSDYRPSEGLAKGLEVYGYALEMLSNSYPELIDNQVLHDIIADIHPFSLEIFGSNREKKIVMNELAKKFKKEQTLPADVYIDTFILLMLKSRVRYLDLDKAAMQFVLFKVVNDYENDLHGAPEVNVRNSYLNKFSESIMKALLDYPILEVEDLVGELSTKILEYGKEIFTYSNDKSKIVEDISQSLKNKFNL